MQPNMISSTLKQVCKSTIIAKTALFKKAYTNSSLSKYTPNFILSLKNDYFTPAKLAPLTKNRSILFSIDGSGMSGGA